MLPFPNNWKTIIDFFTMRYINNTHNGPTKISCPKLVLQHVCNRPNIRNNSDISPLILINHFVFFVFDRFSIFHYIKNSLRTNMKPLFLSLASSNGGRWHNTNKYIQHAGLRTASLLPMLSNKSFRMWDYHKKEALIQNKNGIPCRLIFCVKVVNYIDVYFIIMWKLNGYICR